MDCATILGMKFTNRLRMALDSSPLNQSDLARALNIKPQSVNQWLCGKNYPRHTHMDNIAKALNVSGVWLTTGEGPRSNFLQPYSWSAANNQPQNARCKLPLIPWSQLSAGIHNNISEPRDSQFIESPCQCSSNAFALEIQDDSMSPQFCLGETIVVDSEHTPVKKRYVVVKRWDEDRVVLRLAVTINGDSFLCASNHELHGAHIKLTQDWQILGVVISKFRSYRCE